MAKKIRPILSWILIAAIVLRGLIPVGYMPDASQRSGLLGLRICGGHAHKSPTDPLQANPDMPCSFSVNAAFSFAGVSAPNFASLIVFFAVVFAAAAFAFNPQRFYGNASSRAPPLFRI